MTILAPEDSRLDVGVLQFETIETVPVTNAFTKQVHAVELEPAVRTEGDRLELLSGYAVLPSEFTDWTLKVGMVQDFNDPAGVLEYLRAHAGERVRFSWEPNDEGPEYSGECTLRAGRFGGAVRVRLTTDVEIPVNVLDTPVYPTP